MRQLCETDVLVVGGGPAGIGAALGAARKGAGTLLIENHAFFGGIASFCLGMPINQMRPTGRARSDVHERVIEKLLDYGDPAVKIGEHQLWCNVKREGIDNYQLTIVNCGAHYNALEISR